MFFVSMIYFPALISLIYDNCQFFKLNTNSIRYLLRIFQFRMPYIGNDVHGITFCIAIMNY
jgi:hypothetical protein